MLSRHIINPGLEPSGDKPWGYTGLTGIKKASGFQLLAKGNINGTGDVDLGDAISALKVASASVETEIYPGADVNGDGKIGLEEAIYVLQSVAGLR